MYNKVIMVGNLTKDPELRYTAQGTPVCNMRIAVTNKYRSNDEAKEEKLFIDVVAWGKQGESCSKYLSKGRQILVEGRLKEETWEKDGQTRSKPQIVAANIKFLGKKEDVVGSSGGGGHEEDIEPF